MKLFALTAFVLLVMALSASDGNGQTVYYIASNGQCVSDGSFSQPVSAFASSNGYPFGLGTDDRTVYYIASNGQCVSDGSFSQPVSAFASSNGYPFGLGTDDRTVYYIASNGQCVSDGSFSQPVSAFASSNGYPFGLGTDDRTVYYIASNGQCVSDGSFSQPVSAFASSNGYPFGLGTNPSSISLSNVSNATIITGGTGTLGTTVSNSGGFAANNLNYTLTAAVLSGTATLGLLVPASGTLTPGSSQSCTVPATSTNLGINTISLTANDPNASNSPQTTTATLTVLDHSNASLSSTANQTTQTVTFGNVLRGAMVPSQNFTIYNLAVNTTPAYTANLMLTGFTATGDAALTTSLSPFNGLTAGNGNTYTASLNTANYTTTGSNTATMAASQLVDDSPLPGAGSNNNGAVTVVLQGNVGNATADRSNSQTLFGSPLIAQVAANGSYTGLESKVTATTGSGGYGMVGSTATILDGTDDSGSPETVSMAWRTQTQAERASPGLISDIVCLSGMASNGNETSPFVLQMTYNPALLPLGAGSEGLWASDERIYLAYLDPSDDKWENAIDDNIGTNQGTFQLGAWPTGDMTLGDWGVNTANHTVWAVVDFNGDFAVVPEPSTFALLGVGAIGLIGWAWRRQLLFKSLVCLAVLCIGGYGHADTIPGLFNTGFAADGSLLPDGAVDPHYTLISVPSGSGLGPSTFVVDENEFPLATGPWLPDTPTSKWIAPQADQNNFWEVNNVDGLYTYQTTFDLTGLLASSACIEGQLLSDNTVPDILINGIDLGPVSGGSQFWGWLPFEIMSGFVPGVNTLDFVVDNLPNSAPGINPSGLRVEMAGTAEPVPEPSTFALLAVGAIGLIGWAWRRKRAA